MERVKSFFRGGPSIPTVFLIFVLLMFLTNLSARGMVERIPYSEFKAMISQGTFSEVQLTHDLVRGVVMPENGAGSTGTTGKAVGPPAGTKSGAGSATTGGAPAPAAATNGAPGSAAAPAANDDAPGSAAAPAATTSGATGNAAIPGAAPAVAPGTAPAAAPPVTTGAPVPANQSARPAPRTTEPGGFSARDEFGAGCSGARDPGSKIYEAVRVEEDPDLVRLLDQNRVKYRAVVENNWLQPLILWIALPLAIFMFGSFLMRRMAGSQGPQVMTFGKNRARVVAEEGTGVSFNDVAGIDEAKEELEEVIAFLKTPEKFQKLGGRIPKGVLLVGPPGTGKTLLGRAVAGEAGVPFFSLSGSDFVEMFVGVGAARVRDLFEQAQKRAPCIVFIDELDAIGKARGAGGPLASNDEREQTLNQLLVEMDGFDARKGVIIMGATNRPEILDPALLRAGRFDRTITVGRPDIRGREQILRVHSKKVKLGTDVELKIIAQRTPGFSGSDLANIVNEAALLAARKGKESVNLSDFDEAIERVVAGLSKKHGVLSEREKKIVSYHESGHTVVAATVPNADPVHKVSIIPRGFGALGYTLQMPLEDRYLMGRQELLDRITVLLGGRAAESLVFHDVSTGASDDLTRATEIARKMVKEFGMSERMGQRTYGDARRTNMLGTDGGNGGWPFGGEREYSEETQVAIDEEVSRIISTCYTEARRILVERRADLEVLANRLIEHEVVDRDALDRILGIERDAEGRQVKPRANGATDHKDPIEKLKSGEAAQGEDDVDVTGAHH